MPKLGWVALSGTTLKTGTDLFCVFDSLDLFSVSGDVFKRFCVVHGEHQQEAFPCPHVLQIVTKLFFPFDIDTKAK
jgi:hypothetical protein